MLRRSQPSLTRKSADCVIIGAGVIGCCTALELSRNPDFQNKKILVIDMNPKASMGTTSWSSGIIRTFYTVPQSVRVSYESYWIWRNWNDFIELPSSSQSQSQYAPMRNVKGWICRSKASAEFLDKFKDCATQYSIAFQELDLAETKKIADQNGWDISRTFKPRHFEDPDFATPDPDNQITGSVLVPETGYVADPSLATTTVHDACVRSGKVDFSFKSKVVSIERSENKATGKIGVKSVTLANGDVIDTNIVINCAGPYSSAIQKLAFSNAPVKDDTTLTCRPLRVECAILDGPEGLDCEKDGIVSFDCDTGFYMKPEGRSRVLVGGLDLKGDVMDYISTDELPSTELGGSNHAPGEPAMLSCYRYALRVPSAKLPSGRNQLRGYTSSYDVTEDWSPILDRTTIEGYYTNVGTSGNCFKTAPILGRLMSKIVTTPLDQDLSSVSLDLVLGGTKDNKLPLDCYHRRRNAFDIFGGVIG